jgi:hypothetical protein
MSVRRMIGMLCLAAGVCILVWGLWPRLAGTGHLRRDATWYAMMLFICGRLAFRGDRRERFGT